MAESERARIPAPRGKEPPRPSLNRVVMMALGPSLHMGWSFKTQARQLHPNFK